ncbi:N-acetylmuramoyl-L-alanine amidase [candidate division KSB1 bacterium]
MEKDFYSTDRPAQKIVIPFYKKKLFHASYIILSLTAAAYMIIPGLLEEPPKHNVIRRIDNGRNSVTVYLDPETVLGRPEFAFDSLDTNKYRLELHNSDINYDYGMNYDYGSISRIERERIDEKTAHVILTFNSEGSFISLKDRPVIEYMEDPPRFEISFNKYLDETFVVVIDPGHGGRHAGAVGRNGTQEKAVVLDIALKLEKLMQDRDDILVVLTRRSDRNVSISRRKEISNYWIADLFISIHANGAYNRAVNQSEVYYARQNSQGLARIIRDEFQRRLTNGRGVVRRVGYGVIWNNRANYGAVLTEAMYLSNSTGERLLATDEVRMKIAEALKESIIRVLDSVNIQGEG